MIVRGTTLALVLCFVAHSASAGFDPSFEWQTGSVPLLCQNSFAFKEALAAMNATDPNWLKETGCFVAKPGLKVSLIDAPLSAQNHVDIWYGRIYPTDRAPFNAYFIATAVFTYSLYGPFRLAEPGCD